ncbi:hypothetical protein Mlab_1476 [Methanocorpusculum labreanum Z]|uniref:Peptidase C11, clostripain n=1 Tax=Methanocorpusculum labreanum (strain ATCC 43576 / DSM 4855 / Z) TaxID=410358 RepID=A2STI5_METLZ|nr:clostripain-related cysteine peptidase [Methanocorpusculum labreanum]ABN07641.1 hypothetical protein Mlab_1476 [Methanocorpusculum labreanum Z]
MISNGVVQKTLILGGILLLLITAMIVPVSASSENYLVFYMVGSDLESGEDHLASMNLNDLVNNLDPEITDILVIYGGADQTGWDNGLSITNLDLLKKDLEDGIVGSDEDPQTPTEYVLIRISDVDISSPGALSEGLQYAESYSADNDLASANRYLLFWNHGGGYEGFGANELFDTWMSVDDLQTGLAASKPYDIIIFDACQMASLEVADALDTHADFLLASEENVPGIGLNYVGIGKALSSDPAMTPEEVGKSIISAYVSGTNENRKTLSLVRLQKAKNVVASLDVLGTSLKDSLNNEDSLAALGDIYTTVQGYGRSDDGSRVASVDLYQFADLIYANTEDTTELHRAAGSLMTSLQDYVVAADHSTHFSAANGVSIAAPKEDFTKAIPQSIAFGRNGWYEYFSSYMSKTGTQSQPSASYKSGNTDSRTIVVHDDTETTWAFADYVYYTDSNYIIVGQTPLEEIYAPSEDGLWISVPTGEYEEPDWDGSWFVLRSDGKNADVLVSMTYAYSVVEDESVKDVYLIYGNITREINGKDITHPSVITAVVDMNAMKTNYLFVESVSEDGWYSRTNLWGDTKLLPGDVFTPLLEVYNEEEESISTVYSADSFTFGDDPAEDLVFTALDENNCYWVVELDDYLDDDAFYLEEPDFPDTGAAKSPILPAGMFFGLAAAFLLIKRR